MLVDVKNPNITEADLSEIMQHLKNELTAAKNIIQKYGVYDFEYFDKIREYDYYNGIQYYVILKDGTSFYIHIDSTIFPDINFDDIVYIKKSYVITISRDSNGRDFEYIDTLLGEFNIGKYYHYDAEICKKFNVDFSKEITTGYY